MSLPPDDVEDIRGFAASGTVVRGGAATFAALLGQAVLALGFQALLPRFLSPSDFGTYAIALGASFAFTVLAGLGIQPALTQLPRVLALDREIEMRRLSRIGALSAAVSLAAISPLIASSLGDIELLPILLISAVTIVVRQPAIVAVPILQAHFRFGLVASLTLFAAGSNYVVALMLAASGLGAMALVIGLLVGDAIMSIGSVAARRLVLPSTTTGATATLTRGLALTKWPLAAQITSQASGRIDYLVLGFLAPGAAVGVYFFAFQLVARAGDLLHGVARSVLFPSLAQMSGSGTEQKRVASNAVIVLAVSASFGASLIVGHIDRLELILWDGAWSEATTSIAVLASSMPILVAATGPLQLAKARGRFKLWVGTLLFRVIALVLASAVIGTLVTEGAEAAATRISLVLSCTLGASALVEMSWLGKSLQLATTRMVASSLAATTLLVGFGWLYRVSNMEAVGGWENAAVHVAASAAISVGLLAALLRHAR